MFAFKPDHGLESSLEFTVNQNGLLNRGVCKDINSLYSTNYIYCLLFCSPTVYDSFKKLLLLLPFFYLVKLLKKHLVKLCL